MKCDACSLWDFLVFFKNLLWFSFLTSFHTRPSRGAGDVIGDCKVQFLDEIYQVETPGARPLSASDGQFKRMYTLERAKHVRVYFSATFFTTRRALFLLSPCSSVRACLNVTFFQGRAGRSVSTARLTPRRSAASAPAVCAAGSKTLTCSCCATSVTWRSTSTASTRRWPPSRMTRTGERERERV